MEIGQPDTFRVQGVQGRRLDIRAPVRADIPVTLIIGHDQDHVRPFLPGRTRGRFHPRP